METRREKHLSSRLIATTTLLVLAIVVLFGSIDVQQQGRIFDEQSGWLQHVSLENLHKRGDVQTRDLVQASRTAILQNDYSTLQSFIPQLAPAGDKEVAYAFVADHDGLVLAHSDAAKNNQPIADAEDKELVAATSPQSKRVGTGAERLLVFSRPVEQEGRHVGSVVIAFRLAPLDEQLTRIADDKAKAARAAAIRTAAIGLVCLLLGTAIVVLQSLRISRPLAVLAWRADQLARGDLSTRVEVKSDDEIGRLAESFNFMADQMNVLLHETAQKAVLEKELEVARAIQETLVPPSDLVERPGMKVAGYFQPSSECGGDWWTVNDLPGGKLLVVIGDVTGHGAPAAMITACAKAACDTIRAMSGDALTASSLLSGLNRAIYESARRKFFMTCFASIVDPATRTVRYANAGHNFPYLYRPRRGAIASGQLSGPVTSATTNPGTGPGAAPHLAGSSGDSSDFQVLMVRGNRLGDVEASTYDEKTLSLEAGDTLVYYTDGVVECENDRGEELGEKRFRALLRKAGPIDPVRMRESVVASLGEFFGERRRKDDITMVFARVDG